MLWIFDCTKAFNKYASLYQGLLYCALITMSCTISNEYCPTGYFYWRVEFAAKIKQECQGVNLEYDCFLQTGAQYYVKLKDDLKNKWIGTTKFLTALEAWPNGTKVAEWVISYWKNFSLCEVARNSNAFGCSYDYYFLRPWPTYLLCSFDKMRSLSEFLEFEPEKKVIEIPK